jgi:hypothetical protein
MLSTVDTLNVEFPNERACQGHAAQNGKRAVILEELLPWEEERWRQRAPQAGMTLRHCLADHLS